MKHSRQLGPSAHDSFRQKGLTEAAVPDRLFVLMEVTLTAPDDFVLCEFEHSRRFFR
jgi:hypothetical protein